MLSLLTKWPHSFRWRRTQSLWPSLCTHSGLGLLASVPPPRSFGMLASHLTVATCRISPLRGLWSTHKSAFASTNSVPRPYKQLYQPISFLLDLPPGSQISSLGHTEKEVSQPNSLISFPTTASKCLCACIWYLRMILQGPFWRLTLSLKLCTSSFLPPASQPPLFLYHFQSLRIFVLSILTCSIHKK